MEIIFNIKPISKARPRVARNGHVYTPSKTRQYEEFIGIEYKRQGGKKFIKETPIKADIEFYFKGIKRKQGKPKMTKPDIDNLVKAILDGLNGIAYYDDLQVTSINASKYWADKDYIKLKLEAENE